MDFFRSLPEYAVIRFSKLVFPAGSNYSQFRRFSNSRFTVSRIVIRLDNSCRYQRPDLLVRRHCSWELLNWAELLVSSMRTYMLPAPDEASLENFRWRLNVSTTLSESGRFAKCVARINSVSRSDRTSSDFVVVSAGACGSSKMMTTGLTQSDLGDVPWELCQKDDVVAELIAGGTQWERRRFIRLFSI